MILTTPHIMALSMVGQLHSPLRGVLDENVRRRHIDVEPPTYNEPKPSNKITEIFVLRLI